MAMITIISTPTPAEAALNARLSRMSLAECQDVARQSYALACNGDDNAGIVNDFAMARLAQIMGDSEFIAFCESL